MTPDKKLLKAALGSVGKTFRGEIWEWNSDLPMGKGFSNEGKPFNINEACYLKPPFRALKNTVKKKHVWKAGVQSLKTWMAEKTSAYKIVNEPGDMAIYDCDIDAARDHCKSRLLPLLRGIPEIESLVAEVVNRHDISTTEFYLPGMSLRMWPLNESSTQRFTLRYVIIHDGFLSKFTGMIDNAIARTTQHPKDRLIIIESQGSDEGDDFDRQFDSTDQGMLHVACPVCGEYQPFDFTAQRDDSSFSGFNRGPDEKVLLKDGSYNAAAILRETFYECFHCRKAWRDTPRIRAHLDESSKYVPANPGANVENIGFNWPNWINRRIAWGGEFVMMGYLEAKKALQLYGIQEPIKQWYQKRAAKTWRESLVQVQISIPTSDFDPHAKIENEHHRGLVIDVQQHLTLRDVPGSFWYEVYSVNKSGDSFQLERGFVDDWDKLDEIQARHHIRNSYVSIDGAKWPGEVVQQVAVRRKLEKVFNKLLRREEERWITWKVLVGDGRASSFPSVATGHGKPAHNVWSQPVPHRTIIMNAQGKGESVMVPIYRFSSNSVSDQLHSLLIGGEGKPKFIALPREKCSAATQAKEVGDYTYENQMRAETRIPKNGRMVWEKMPNRQNHYWDLAKMRLVRIGMAGLAGHMMMVETV